MTDIKLVRSEIGGVGVGPGDLRLETNASYDEIIAPKFLSNNVSYGLSSSIFPTDIISAVYKTDGIDTIGFFIPIISPNDIIELAPIMVLGDLDGPPSSANNDIVVFADDTGTLIKAAPISAISNGLIGYDSNAELTVRAISGPPLQISSNVLSMPSDVYGDIFGPSNSVNPGSLAIFNTDQNIINFPSPANSSLLGYASTSQIANVITDANFNIAGNTISLVLKPVFSRVVMQSGGTYTIDPVNDNGKTIIIDCAQSTQVIILDDIDLYADGFYVNLFILCTPYTSGFPDFKPRIGSNTPNVMAYSTLTGQTSATINIRYSQVNILKVTTTTDSQFLLAGSDW